MRISLPTLAFTSLITATALASFINWAQMPPDRYGYWGKQEIAYQVLKINKNPDDLTKEKLIWVACETKKVDEAHWLMQAMQAGRRMQAMKTYDNAYSIGYSKLATIELCATRIGNALLFYQQQLAYDQRFLAVNDKRIGRDYNNLGMAYFMQGQTSKENADRDRNWRLADDMLAKAATTKMVEDPLLKLSMVQNKLLLAEGRGDLPEIARLQDTTQQLRAQLNVKVPVVQF